MPIRVAESAGFCPGVRQAVRLAEKTLQASREAAAPLCMYGEIVHNESVVQELLASGFRLVYSAAEVPRGATVLIRAHGIPREEEAALRERGVHLLDGTCPWVRKIQRLAAAARREGQAFYILGDASHPEVQGILSYGPSDSVVLADPAAAEAIPFSDRSSIIAAQTTFAVKKAQEICKVLEKRLPHALFFDTICATTTERQEEAESLAREVDWMLVLGSSKSSNTRKLFALSASVCDRTYLIQRPDQVSALFQGRDLRQVRIGITAGASTPERMIREVIHVMTEQENVSMGQEATEELQNQEQLTVEVASPTDAQPADAGNDANSSTVNATEEPAVMAAAITPETEPQTPVEESTAVSLPTAEQVESGEMSFSDYIEGIPQLKRGAIVKGNIVRYDSDFVYVDVRDKSEGKVPIHEFSGDLDFDIDQAVAERREIDVYVRSIKNSDMGKEILLSKARVDFDKHKELIREAFENKTPVTVKITSVVKDGVIGSFGSVDMYIHRTQLELHPVDDLEPYRGQTMEVLVTQFDPNRKRLRVSGSRRALISRARRQASREIWENIEVGKEYEGTVRNITDFGAFVDIGGVDGLVHVSELSWKRIHHPSEVVQIGDKLNVFVKDFDKEKKRISLGYRRPENDPYHNIEERFPVGSIVRGIVVRMFPFGAFIEIAPGVDALCHISQISNYHLNRPEDVLQVGMEVDARVLEVSNADRKISISIREVEPIDPANPEAFVQQPRGERRGRGERREQRDENEENRGAERRRGGRRNNRQDENNDLPTTYMDTASGSSFASLANFTVASKEGEETLKNLGLEGEASANTDENA